MVGRCVVGVLVQANLPWDWGPKCPYVHGMGPLPPAPRPLPLAATALPAAAGTALAPLLPTGQRVHVHTPPPPLSLPDYLAPLAGSLAQAGAAEHDAPDPRLSSDTRHAPCGYVHRETGGASVHMAAGPAGGGRPRRGLFQAGPWALWCALLLQPGSLLSQQQKRPRDPGSTSPPRHHGHAAARYSHGGRLDRWAWSLFSFQAAPVGGGPPPNKDPRRRAIRARRRRVCSFASASPPGAGAPLRLLVWNCHPAPKTRQPLSNQGSKGALKGGLMRAVWESPSHVPPKGPFPQAKPSPKPAAIATPSDEPPGVVYLCVRKGGPKGNSAEVGTELPNRDARINLRLNKRTQRSLDRGFAANDPRS